MTRRIVFATGNSAKLREASEILGPAFELVSPASMGLTEEIPETAPTLLGNSMMKAGYIHEKLSCDCFADDTGLEVDILGGAPGVHSARYATDGHDFAANVAKLLREMARAEREASVARAYGLAVKASRKARFRTVVTLILGGQKHFFEGCVEGRIARRRSGDGGFGYDPVFIPDFLPGDVPNSGAVTMAQLSEEDKNAISPRGRALRAMAAWLADNEA